MADTVVELNNNFAERYKGSSFRRVTNNLGRTVAYKELVYLDGLFGSVEEEGGIANGASGYIDIADDREISTNQVASGATFTAGNVLFFISGGSSAEGTLTSIATAAAKPVGKITAEFGTGGAQTGVKFRPFVQNVGAPTGSLVKCERVVIDAATDYSTTGKATGIPIGSTIVDALAICTAANTGGTAQVVVGTTGLFTALVMAVDKTTNRMAAAVEHSKLVTDAAVTVKTHAIGDAGIVEIFYI